MRSRGLIRANLHISLFQAHPGFLDRGALRRGLRLEFRPV